MLLGKGSDNPWHTRGEIAHVAFMLESGMIGMKFSGMCIEIAGAEAIPGEVRVAPKQNPPIPDFRFLALLDREMRIDVGAPLVGERPRPRTDVQIEGGDAMNRDWQHRPTPPTSGRPPLFSRSDRRTSCSDRSWRPSSRGRTAAAGSGRFAFPAG